MKISIIGGGNVGGLAAMRIAESGLGDVFLIDVIKNIAEAKAEDIKDSISLIKKNANIFGTDDITYIKDSNIIIVTAGIARKPGMSRDDLLKINADIVRKIALAIKAHAQKSIVIVVSNPVDVMTYLMLKETGFDKKRVFGMGSSLDSARFCTLIAKKLKVKNTAIKSMVIGSHSDTMIPLSRLAKINNKGLQELAEKKDVDDIMHQTKYRGAEIVKLFGNSSAYFAPSSALLKIVKAIVNNRSNTIAVSCFLDGEYQSYDVCIGVPAKITNKGIADIVELRLNTIEKEEFLESVKKIKESISLLQQN